MPLLALSLLHARRALLQRLALATVLIGVAACYSWEEQSFERNPWSAPGVRAVTMTKERISWGSVGPQHSVALRDARGKKHDSEELLKELDAYLTKSGLYASLPKSGGWINGIQRAIAPCELYWVSITPTVLICKPREYLVTQGRSLYEIMGGYEPTSFLDSALLLNALRITTDVPSASSAKWLSPARNAKLADIPMDANGNGLIDLGPERLRLTKNGELWHVTRETVR